jgi:hypothetical protein
MRLLLVILMVAFPLAGQTTIKRSSSPSASSPIKITGLRVGGDSDLPLLIGTAKNTGSQSLSFFYKVRFLDSSGAVVWTMSAMGGPIGPGEIWRIDTGILSKCAQTRPQLIEVQIR